MKPKFPFLLFLLLIVVIKPLTMSAQQYDHDTAREHSFGFESLGPNDTSTSVVFYNLPDSPNDSVITIHVTGQAHPSAPCATYLCPQKQAWCWTGVYSLKFEYEVNEVVWSNTITEVADTYGNDVCPQPKDFSYTLSVPRPKGKKAIIKIKIKSFGTRLVTGAGKNMDGYGAAIKADFKIVPAFPHQH